MLASGQYGLMKHYSNHFSSSTPLYSANTVECHLKSPFLASKPQCHNHSFITYLLSYLTKVTGDPGLSLGISKPTGFASDSGYEWALARKTPKPTPCFLQAPTVLKVCVMLSVPFWLAKSLRHRECVTQRWDWRTQVWIQHLSYHNPINKACRLCSLSYLLFLALAFIFPFRVWLSKLPERTIRKK